MIGHNLHMDILHVIKQFFTPIPEVCFSDCPMFLDEFTCFSRMKSIKQSLKLYFQD